MAAPAYDLKDETQAKEYLDNIGVEYRYQCFQEKDADGCHRLGDFLEAVRREFDKARAVYKTNCYDSRHGHSCFKYGNYNLLGRAGKEDKEKARDAYAKSCEYGYEGGCHGLGLLYQGGEFKEGADFVKAKECYERGCELGNPDSCYHLAGFYIEGKKGIPKDFTAAFRYSKIACDKEHMYACGNLSRMYNRGDGVQRDDDLSKKYKKIAMDLFKQRTEADKQLKFGE